MADRILVERRGRITIFTIDRAEALNALDRSGHFEMAEKVDAFAADPEQWVAIVTGAGDRAFCAGNDLKQRLGPDDAPVPATGFAGLTARFDLTKPLIAAVNGLAFGGGFELVLACDLVVAVRSAKFALPEVRVGLAAMAGGLLRLPRLIGAKRAADMILTARRIDAAEAEALGLVNRIVADGRALDGALDLAESLLLAGPLAMRASKAVMARALDGDVAAAMDAHLGWPEIIAMRASEDAIEGPRAFAEKRAPVWRAR